MKTDNILKQHQLADGFRVVVTDATRHYFGGYYHVRLLITADVALLPSYFQSDSLHGEALLLLGPQVRFSRVLEKMAVPESDMDAVRKSLIGSFEETLLPYLARPDFRCRYVGREYEKALKDRLKTGKRRCHE